MHNCHISCSKKYLSISIQLDNTERVLEHLATVSKKKKKKN